MKVFPVFNIYDHFGHIRTGISSAVDIAYKAEIAIFLVMLLLRAFQRSKIH